MAGEEKSPLSIWNVKMYFGALFFYALMFSISMGATFDAYLYQLATLRGGGDDDANFFVGTVESVSGLVALVFALPLGIIADKLNKRKMMQFSTSVATSGVFAYVFGILWDSVPLIYAGVVIFALHMQIFMSCGPALIADSVPKHQVQDVTAKQGSVFAMTMAAGPLLQIVLVLLLGNTWNMRQLHMFCVAGFVFYPIALIFILLLRPTQKELELQANSLGQQLAAESGGGESAEAQNRVAAEEMAGAPPAESVDDAWKEDKVFGIKKKWFVPLLIEFCSLITACGAGMTVKFFPLFFKKDYGLQPIAFNALTFSGFIAVGLFVTIFQRVSQRIGILPSAMFCHVAGTACLFLLWSVKSFPLLVVMYMLRGGIMNAKGPIDSGIIMSCVDSKYRGRWAALQSLSRVSWAGSAALGGWLADSHDYRFAFLITGFIYSASACFYAPLLCIVPPHVGRKKLEAGAR